MDYTDIDISVTVGDADKGGSFICPKVLLENADSIETMKTELMSTAARYADLGFMRAIEESLPEMIALDPEKAKKYIAIIRRIAYPGDFEEALEFYSERSKCDPAKIEECANLCKLKY